MGIEALGRLCRNVGCRGEEVGGGGEGLGGGGGVLSVEGAGLEGLTRCGFLEAMSPSPPCLYRTSGVRCSLW